MTTIEKIVNKLREFPAARYDISGETVTVEAAGEEGFSVWLTERGPGYTVGYDEWHEDFEDEGDALAAFALGLSEDCRLKVMRRGKTDCAWTVESRNDDGQWTEGSSTGLLFTSFWRKRAVVYRQNHFITGNGRAAVSG